MRILSTAHDKRRRRTDAEIAQLDAQILEVLAADHPQSVRHVFYCMTNPRLPEPVEKSDRGYRHVQYRITQLRREGRIPYGWIADATRRGYFTYTYQDASDFLRNHIAAYRADLWRNAGCLVEVWCESRSIAGVIEDDCRDLAVSLYPAGGFSSITFAYDAACGINAATRGGEIPAHIIYIGDFDPAGVLIDASLEQEIRAHLSPSISLYFERMAITEAQIARFDLPTKPRKAGDRRSMHVKETVEAEAMPAHIMRAMLRNRIESFLPVGAIETARVVEREERKAMNLLALLADNYDVPKLYEYIEGKSP